jgi:hypothetical protein
VHKEAIVIAVQSESGKLVMESVIETKASSILEFLHGLRGELHVTSPRPPETSNQKNLRPATWRFVYCVRSKRDG